VTVGVDDMHVRRFVAGLVIVLFLAAALRAAWPTADPPWHPPVGITWHDEGPWVHNARNKALWGTWTTDAWNPMYLAPVFTALEYVALEAFGVGQWQVRVVPAVMGLLAILAIGIGAATCGTRRTGLVAAALLASNVLWVHWSRAALMEGPMTAFIAISWSAYALAARRPWWGAVAGVAGVLAVFTKAAAAFYLAALGTEAAIAIGIGLLAARSARVVDGPTRAALWLLGGVALAGGLFAIWFVAPHWQEVRFYNWQMSVTRKPSYGLHAFLDRASWLPIVHDFFTRMWLVTLAAIAGVFSLLLRWRSAPPAERLLGLSIGLGVLELVVHDVGNERRLVFLIPLLIVLAAIVLTRNEGLLPAWAAGIPRTRALLGAPLVAYAAYVACGAIARLGSLYEVRPGVRLGAAAALVVTVALYVFWPRVVSWLTRARLTPRAVALVTTLIVAGDLAQYGQWAMSRTYKNVEASQLVGAWLPPGTLVQGKLANGLALENRIRPVFVGRGFGNYDDRFTRDDVRYLLTYVKPRLGYEGPVIRDVLEACPGWRILRTFDVAETATGQDRAALILKAPHCAAVPPRSPSAKD
jgi:4-amino-4-deoxy-L-arabinose transferase-like glycosyltransferase